MGRFDRLPLDRDTFRVGATALFVLAAFGLLVHEVMTTPLEALSLFVVEIVFMVAAIAWLGITRPLRR